MPHACDMKLKISISFQLLNKLMVSDGQLKWNIQMWRCISNINNKVFSHEIKGPLLYHTWKITGWLKLKMRSQFRKLMLLVLLMFGGLFWIHEHHLKVISTSRKYHNIISNVASSSMTYRNHNIISNVASSSMTYRDHNIISNVASSSKIYRTNNIISDVASSSKTYQNDKNNIVIHRMKYGKVMRKYPDLKQGNGTMKRFPSAIVIGTQKGGTGKSKNIFFYLQRCTKK